MICDVLEVDSHKYYPPENGLIGYQDQDQISYNISHGYITMFAYYKEHELGTVSDETLKANKTLIINCGEFSYAEVPHFFSIILGVSGTLEAPPLTEIEKNII